MSDPDFELALVALLASILIGLALIGRRLQGSWLAPGAAFALFWAIMGAGPVLMLDFFPISPSALVLVILFVVAVLTGSQLALFALAGSERPSRHRVEADIAAHGHVSGVSLITVALGCAALPAADSFLNAVGISWDSLTSFSGWVAAAARLTIARYEQGFVEPLTARVCMALVYAGSLFGGVAMAYSSRVRERIAVLVPVIGGTVVGQLTTMKLVLMLPPVLAASTYLVCRLGPRRNGLPERNGRQFMWVIAAIAFILVAISVSMMSRYGSEYDQIGALVVTKLATYAFGHMSVLSSWLDDGGAWVSDPSWGARTFSGIFALFGLGARKAGLYDVVITNDFVAHSNVFTVFRGLIEDFSLPGALVFALFIGVVGGFAFSQVRSAAVLSGWSAVLAAFYVLTAWSFATSIFTYNSVLVAFVGFYGYCAWVGHRRSIK